MSVEDLYERLARHLPEAEQRQLASSIVWKCAKTGAVDYNSGWSVEDLRDFTAYSMALFAVHEVRDIAIISV